ncbi:MAG TPA: hypothetical protein DCE31_06465, partial [Lautropia sp.]|nr:hypothetical protein [Lautropia sp.]
MIGLFVSAPFFALQSIPMRFRIALGLLLGFGIPLETNVLSSLSLTMSTASYATLAVGEFLIGAVSGWLIRIGLMVFDVSAEVISIQTGLSFASSYNPDQALPSGVLGQVFGLLGLALIFSL